MVSAKAAFLFTAALAQRGLGPGWAGARGWSISVDLDGTVRPSPTARAPPFKKKLTNSKKNAHCPRQPTPLEFDEDTDVRARAEQFMLEKDLHMIPGAGELADQLVREMENTMVYTVEQGAKSGTFSWEPSAPDERAALQLVVVDDFMAQPAALRAFGRAQHFGYKGNHPGMRTASFANMPEFRPVRRRVEALVGERLPYWFAAFQLSRANDTDNAIHRDYPTYKYSAVLYLTPGAPCRFGTSTYRHLSTGLVSHPDEEAARRRNTTVEALEATLYEDSTEDKYEEMDRVGNRYNRLIVFNSRVNHRR